MNLTVDSNIVISLIISDRKGRVYRITSPEQS